MTLDDQPGDPACGGGASRRGSTGRAGTGPKAYLVPAMLMLLAVAGTWVYRIDLPHAVAIVAGALSLGTVYGVLDRLVGPPLRLEVAPSLDQGSSDAQFLAFCLQSNGNRIGTRVHQRFAAVAASRLDRLGIDLPMLLIINPRLHALCSDPDRGARMTHGQLFRCLDQLDELAAADAPRNHEPDVPEPHMPEPHMPGPHRPGPRGTTPRKQA